MAGRPRQFDEDQALRRAMELFWAEGYEAVGVRELLDAMGVCRQSFYDTFGDKRQLFLRAIERYTTDASREMADRLATPGPAIDSLRAVLANKAAGAAGGECRGCLAMNAMVEWGASDDEVAGLLKENVRQLERLFAKTIRRAQQQGDVDPAADAKRLAQFFAFVCLGYSALERLGLPRSMAQAVLETALSAVPAAPAV